MWAFLLPGPGLAPHQRPLPRLPAPNCPSPLGSCSGSLAPCSDRTRPRRSFSACATSLRAGDCSQVLCAPTARSRHSAPPPTWPTLWKAAHSWQRVTAGSDCDPEHSEPTTRGSLYIQTSRPSQRQAFSFSASSPCLTPATPPPTLHFARTTWSGHRLSIWREPRSWRLPPEHPMATQL